MAGEACDDRRELLALHAVGLLDADRESELAAHLETCAACAATLRLLTAAAAAAGTDGAVPMPRAELVEDASASVLKATRAYR
jgi:anti-sigma factor RsiW